MFYLTELSFSESLQNLIFEHEEVVGIDLSGIGIVIVLRLPIRPDLKSSGSSSRVILSRLRLRISHFFCHYCLVSLVSKNSFPKHYEELNIVVREMSISDRVSTDFFSSLQLKRTIKRDLFRVRRRGGSSQSLPRFSERPELFINEYSCPW